MQSHLINPKDGIKAYQVIVDKGQKLDRGYTYKGITAESDIDGYTVFLRDDNVTFTVYYHYKYTLDYPANEALERFKAKIKAILSE